MRRTFALEGVFAACHLALAACGARTGLRVRDASEDPRIDDVVVFDAPDAPDVTDTMDVTDVSDATDVADAPDAIDAPDACVPVEDRCGPVEICGNGLDDNCNGASDERCPCEPGMVQPCFAGPPGRRNVGVCRDGTQLCLGDGTWSACLGGIVPGDDVCNGADNLCNGCSQQSDCPILCPLGDGDPRVPTGAPFREYVLRGADFYRGPATSWRWQIEGGPCDRLSRLRSFTLRDERTSSAVFTPSLSGDYTVRLSVTTPAGRTLTCSWIVHVEGPGLRVEMCYPESETMDLDLFLHRPNDRSPWYGTPSDVFRPSNNVCGWHNCEAAIRGMGLGGPVARADWGYPRSPLRECENGPQGDQWRALGFCANPRLDIDNNLSEGTGVPENINVDQPRDGERFRIMVQNFTGTRARPLVNVYCAGRRMATLGAPPDEVPRFEAARSGPSDIGAMWRVADVLTRVDATGVTNCIVTPLHPPGATRGYWVTVRDPQY